MDGVTYNEIETIDKLENSQTKSYCKYWSREISEHHLSRAYIAIGGGGIQCDAIRWEQLLRRCRQVQV